MRKLALFIAFVGVVAGAASFAGETAREVLISVSDAYIPRGFDSNSDTFVVVSGVFPNGCYRWSKADVTHTTGKTHEVKSFARVQPGMCLMVLVPFTREVQLGKLEAGEHKIRFVAGDGTWLEKSLVIE